MLYSGAVTPAPAGGAGETATTIIFEIGCRHACSVSLTRKAGNIGPLIDRWYTLSQVPEALRYVLEGRAKDKVVITVE